MDDRALRISVLLAAHVIFLSAGALRIIRGQRGHLLRSHDAWWLQYYPPLVWVPFVIAYFFPFPIDLPMPVRLVGLAVASALRDRPADPRTVFVGELGLGGELRRVQRIAARLKEAERLGFERAVVPSASLGDLNGTALEVSGVASLREALERAGVADR